MDLTGAIKRYDAVEINEKELSKYERFALRLFHNTEIISNPNLELTIQLDITAADEHYKIFFSSEDGATMTAYLYWCLIQTVKKHPCFSYREIDNKWYYFQNPPLFFPVAVGNQERFGEVLIENVFSLDWPNFCRIYRSAVDRFLREKPPHEPLDLETWHIAIFIGNLPNIQFTHFGMHMPSIHIGRPMFYFGKRYKVEDKKFVPFYSMFDHSNLDPYIMGLFLEDYEKMLSSMRVNL